MIHLRISRLRMLRNHNSGLIAISKERVDIQEIVSSKAKINSTKIAEELKEEADSEVVKEA